VLSGTRFEARVSDAILQEMWEKWVFIATGAGITCLMRAAIGDIVAAGAADLSAKSMIRLQLHCLLGFFAAQSD
jgi:2-dehydropantoate 2-reductase